MGGDIEQCTQRHTGLPVEPHLFEEARSFDVRIDEARKLLELRGLQPSCRSHACEPKRRYVRLCRLRGRLRRSLRVRVLRLQERKGGGERGREGGALGVCGGSRGGRLCRC